MSAPHGQGPPRSSVSRVMEAVKTRYAAIGDPATVLVGQRNLPPVGAPPRVVMARGGGKVSGPGRVGDGNVARVGQSFRAFLWADDTTDDLTRDDAAEDMVDRLINIVRALTAGRAEITVLDTTDVSVQSFGEQRQILVTWSRGVPRDAVVWSSPIAPQPTPDPMKPNGDTGDIFEFDPTTNGSR